MLVRLNLTLSEMIRSRPFGFDPRLAHHAFMEFLPLRMPIFDGGSCVRRRWWDTCDGRWLAVAHRAGLDWGWLLAVWLCGVNLASAQGTKAKDDLLEELTGPSKESIAVWKTEARAGTAESGVEAIWKLGQHENGIPALLEVLAGAPPDVIPNILISLGWQGSLAKAGLGPVTDCLAKPSFHTQTAAVWALGRIGDKASIPKLQPFLKASHELLRFLAEEAITRCQGKELLPNTPASRPLKQATLLHVSDIDEKASDFLFREALQGLDVSWKAITVQPFNPSWSGIGGMPATEEEKFSQLLAFADGQPQVAAVLISNLYPGELSFRLRWELWNYVRRGGNLVMSSILFQPISGRSKFKFNYAWRSTVFDTLLPKSIGAHDAPFLDGVGQPERSRYFGEAAYGRGRVVVHDKDPGQSQRWLKAGAVPIATLFKFSHEEWRHLTRVRNIGNNVADSPLLWRQLFTQMVEGPSAFIAGVDVPAMPAFKAGLATVLPLVVKNYNLPATEFQLDLTLQAEDGGQLVKAQTTVEVQPKKTAKTTVALAVPFALSSDRGVLQIVLTDRAGQPVRQERIPVRLVPAFRIALESPDTFAAGTRDLAVKASVAEAESLKTAGVRVIASLADMNLRPLLREVREWRQGKVDATDPTGVERRGTEFEFHFDAHELPPGGYWVTVEVEAEGKQAAFRKRFLAAPKLWRGRGELGFLLWGTSLNLPPEGWARLRAANLHGGGLPEAGYSTWAIGGTEFPFTPYGQWRADILAGPGGEAIRRAAEKLSVNPFFSALDVVEESDLEVGTAVKGIGNVEQKGFEQYRIHLKQKYGTLAGLNSAWKSDYLDWSEIRLLGGVKQSRDEVTYTSRIGGTSGELVPVPEKLEPAKGILSLAPFVDQNAWRWSYMWQLIEVWHQAFHESDMAHGLMPGGHMGLAAPFDFPHTRIYAGNAMSVLGMRATLGRPTYGEKPHIILMGLPEGDAANLRLVWQGLASGARLTTIYAPGDGYGVKLMSADFKLTRAGESIAAAVAKVLPRQEVFLATRNAISQDVLFLGGESLSPEYYEAFLRSGVLVDFDRSPLQRKLIVSGAGSLSTAARGALQAHVAKGGTLLLLDNTPVDLLKEMGLEVTGDASRKGRIDRVQLDGNGPWGTLDKAAFTSGGRRQLTRTDPAWQPLARYAQDKEPAVLRRTLGKGAVWFFNFHYQYSTSLDLLKEASSINEENQALREARQKLQQDWYAPGTVARREVESFRRLLAAIMDQAGVARAAETVDRDGSVIPYVEAQLLETFDQSQRYLVVWADHHLPPGITNATGQIALKIPGIKAVHDVYRDRDAAVSDGRFAFTLNPGEGTVYSLLTEPVGALQLATEASAFSPGHAMRIAVRPRNAGGQPAASTHSFNVEVRGPDGRLMPGLESHVSGWGHAIATLIPAWNDPEGEWTIEAEDLTTGRRATAKVTMKKSGPPTQSREPGLQFRPAAPELVLRCTPLELPGFAHFVPLKATLQSNVKRPVKVRVTLELPASVERLGGELSRELTLKPDGTGGDLSWDLFVSRDEAVAMYYSGMPAGFRVGLGPEVHQYADTAYPALRVEVLEEQPLRFAAAPDADWQTGRLFRTAVPVRLMPLESRPPQVGPVSSEPAELVIWNRLERQVKATLRVATADTQLRPLADMPVEVRPGTNQAVRLDLAAAAPVMLPALVNLPVTLVADGRPLSAGRVTVESVIQRNWLVRAGTEDTSDKNIAKLMDRAGALAEAGGWSAMVANRVEVPLAGSLQNAAQTAAAAPFAYAFSRVWSPAKRDITVRLTLVGAEGRVWLNGKLVHASAGNEPADSSAVFEKEFGLTLAAGWNPILVELQQLRPRYLDPPLTILTKNGETVRDLVFDANGSADPFAPRR